VLYASLKRISGIFIQGGKVKVISAFFVFVVVITMVWTNLRFLNYYITLSATGWEHRCVVAKTPYHPLGLARLHVSTAFVSTVGGGLKKRFWYTAHGTEFYVDGCDFTMFLKFSVY